MRLFDCVISRLAALILFGLCTVPALFAAPFASGASVSGTVSDISGRGIPGAAITITSSAGINQTTKSDRAGKYSLTGVSQGTYAIGVTAPGYKVFEVKDVSFVGDDVVPLDVVLERGGQAVAAKQAPGKSVAKRSKPSGLSGTVTDAAGSPLPGAKVAVTNATGSVANATADSKGNYSVTGLPAGTYDVIVSATSFKDFQASSVTLTAGAIQPLDALLESAQSATSTPPASDQGAQAVDATRPPVAPQAVANTATSGSAGSATPTPTQAPATTTTTSAETLANATPQSVPAGQSSAGPSAAPGAPLSAQTGSARSVAEIVINVMAAPEENALAAITAKQNPAAASVQEAKPGAVTATTNAVFDKNGGTLSGTVTDQTGAVLSGATVTVSSAAGYRQITTTDGKGNYAVRGIPPGKYNVAVTSVGFKVFNATDLTLVAGDSIPLDATLEAAGEKQEVSVEASGAASVQTENANVEGTITAKEVTQLQLNGRNFTQLIALTPGVSNQTGQDEAKVGVTGSVKYSVNGGRVEYNSFDVDGSDVLNAGLNGAESTLVVYPSIDAISEIKVLTSNYGAQYGKTASGTVLVTTKSGAEQFHGNAYEFLRNEFFNARNFFDQTNKAPLYRRNDLGFTLGGPLFIPGHYNTNKDKTFFFFSEELRLEKSPQEYNQAVPSAAERAGNFSDVCPLAFASAPQPAFLPAKFPDCPNVGAVNTTYPLVNTFTLNQLPLTAGVQLDPNAVKLLNTGVIPLPNNTTGCNSTAGSCYDYVISPPTYWREELFRLDHHFNTNLLASFRYIHDSWNTTLPAPLWGYIQNSFPSVENKLDGPGISMVARLTDTITPTLLNEFVFSYVDSHITLTDANGPGTNFQRPPGLTYGAIFQNGFGGKIPGIVIGGSNAEYGGNGFSVDASYPPWTHTNPTYSLSDDISKVAGHHTLHLGVQIVNAQKNEDNAAIGAATGDIQGILTYNNVKSPGGSTGNAFADFLYDRTGFHNFISSFQQDSAQVKYYNDYWITEPYIQDDWRVNRHLIVNLGVRFSLFGNFREKNNNAYNWEQSAFDPKLAATVYVDQATGALFDKKNHQPIALDLNNLNPILTNGLVRCGINGIPNSCMKSHIFNPAPRIGFAWDPTGNGKTSIRAGYGIFYEHGTGKEANTGSLEGNAPLVLTMTQPIVTLGPNIGTVLNRAGNAVAASFPLDVTSIPTKTVWSNVQQWSLSIQQQLPKDMLATFAYVGSKGTHLTTELQLNQLQPLNNIPDTGIDLNGNPFQPGQPLTNVNCNPDANGSYTVNNITVTKAQPAWTNLTAACFGVNPPGSNVGAPVPPPDSLRTFAPGYGRILSLQNVADSHYNAFQSTIRRTKGPVTVGVSYTWSHSIDDSSDRSDSTFVNSFDLKANKASSNFDQRHLLNVSYVYTLPKFSTWFQRWATTTDSDSDSTPLPATPGNLAHVLGDGWEFSGITVFQSGTPFSVINGGGGSTGISVLDNAGVANGSGAGSYVDVVGDPHSAPLARDNKNSIGPLLYNPAAFAAPQGLTFGNSGRNFLTNPHRTNFDVALLKHFKIKERHIIEFRVEAFNVFNHTQFRIYNPNLGNNAHNTINCYGPGPLSNGAQLISGPNLLGPNFSAAGGTAQFFNIPGNQGLPQYVTTDCISGGSFLRPVDAHRPRTLQFGLKYSF